MSDEDNLWKQNITIIQEVLIITNVTWQVCSLTLEMDDVGAGASDELEEEPSASQMAGKSPNFCVLLHGSLKVEGMVALVQLG